MKLNDHISAQLDKQHKARAMVRICETLHRAGLLRLLQVGYFRNTEEFDEEETFIVCIKVAQGDDEVEHLEHYEWTI